MKTTFEKIRLTVNTQKNSLPVNKPIVGSLKVARDIASAKFNEVPRLSDLIPSHSIRLKQKPGYTVSFNPEKNTYRITIGINPNNPEWIDLAADNFDDCLEYLEDFMED